VKSGIGRGVLQFDSSSDSNSSSSGGSRQAKRIFFEGRRSGSFFQTQRKKRKTQSATEMEFLKSKCLYKFISHNGTTTQRIGFQKNKNVVPLCEIVK
jgi:hypothetical protein